MSYSRSIVARPAFMRRSWLRFTDILTCVCITLRLSIDSQCCNTSQGLNLSSFVCWCRQHCNLLMQKRPTQTAKQIRLCTATLASLPGRGQARVVTSLKPSCRSYCLLLIASDQFCRSCRVLQARASRQHRHTASYQDIPADTLLSRVHNPHVVAATEVANMFTLHSSVPKQSTMVCKQCSDSVMTLWLLRSATLPASSACWQPQPQQLQALQSGQSCRQKHPPCGGIGRCTCSEAAPAPWQWSAS